MKLKTLILHNIRSVKDATIYLSDYSMLAGENNSGKTNVLTAIRLFYEDNIKFKKDTDFPMFSTDDNESWIELHFETAEDEQDGLKDEYKSADRVLKVRKYFQSDDNDLVKSNQSNIYAYEDGKLSTNLFYGAKNVSQAKLGRVIYIPAVSRTDDTLKTTGPSPFRDMVNFVMKRAVLDSNTFSGLSDAFDKFNDDFKDESSKDGFSINMLTEDINEEIKAWKVKFGINVNPVKPDDLVKNMLSHYIEDTGLGGQQVALSSFGQGLQRHLIFTLIKLSAKYTSSTSVKKKEFDPDFTLLLFEEPEAFLHPSQQQALHTSLRKLAVAEPEQVLISSHSPHFVSKQIQHITGIVRVQKEDGITTAHQITSEDFDQLVDENLGMYKLFCKCLTNNDIPQAVRAEIKKKKLGEDEPNESSKIEEEALKYCLWLDAERSSMFFAKKVIICEGASEKIFLDFMCEDQWPDLQESQTYFLDSLGKYNIHRYIGLLSALGIPHSVLMDSDEDKGVHKIINQFINDRKTPLTNCIHSFDSDLEDFLGVDKPKRGDLKPLSILLKAQQDKIDQGRIDSLRTIIESL